MNMTKKEREEFCDLSQAVFGTRYKWKKLLDKGVRDFASEKTMVTVPGADGAPDTFEEQTVLKLDDNGNPYKVHVRFTLEEVRTLMLKYQDQLVQQMAAELQRRNDAEKAKTDLAVQSEVHNSLSGSAI